MNSITRKVLQVPSIILAYNLYMNSVDIVDQRRKATYTRRKESKISMNFLQLILDYAIHNAYALFQWDRDRDIVKTSVVTRDLNAFKQHIAISLCDENKKIRETTSSGSKRLYTTPSRKIVTQDRDGESTVSIKIPRFFNKKGAPGTAHLLSKFAPHGGGRTHQNFPVGFTASTRRRRILGFTPDLAAKNARRRSVRAVSVFFTAARSTRNLCAFWLRGMKKT